MYYTCNILSTQLSKLITAVAGAALHFFHILDCWSWPLLLSYASHFTPNQLLDLTIAAVEAVPHFTPTQPLELTVVVAWVTLRFLPWQLLELIALDIGATPHLLHPANSQSYYSFHASDLFWYALKTSENLWFSDVFRGYQKRSVAWNGLM